jgi:hypothetical protein
MTLPERTEHLAGSLETTDLIEVVMTAVEWVREYGLDETELHVEIAPEWIFDTADPDGPGIRQYSLTVSGPIKAGNAR